VKSKLNDEIEKVGADMSIHILDSYHDMGGNNISKQLEITDEFKKFDSSKDNDGKHWGHN